MRYPGNERGSSANKLVHATHAPQLRSGINYAQRVHNEFHSELVYRSHRYETA